MFMLKLYKTVPLLVALTLTIWTEIKPTGCKAKKTKTESYFLLHRVLK